MIGKALVWVRDDFRIANNSALINASLNHEQVSAVYIFNRKNFDNKREAQKWWISKSLENFKKDLDKFNIDLEVKNLSHLNQIIAALRLSNFVESVQRGKD